MQTLHKSSHVLESIKGKSKTKQILLPNKCHEEVVTVEWVCQSEQICLELVPET